MPLQDDYDQPQKRWYDKDTIVSKAIRTLGSFPPDIQQIVAEGTMKLAERECRIKELLANLRSLGPEKVLSIHKSKNKRRFYDQNPVVHQAINALYVMSEGNRKLVGTQVLEIMNYILEYMQVCTGLEVAPNARDVEQITDTYIELGPDQVSSLLTNITDRFKRSLKKAMDAPVPTKKQDETLREDEEGMRIREERPFGETPL